jgi:hypothetical protein
VSTATNIYSDLQSLAHTRGRATSEILTIYGLERFVDRLTCPEFRDDFVLKAGILLAAYQLRRPTRDIDMQALDFPSTRRTYEPWSAPQQPSASTTPWYCTQPT